MVCSAALLAPRGKEVPPMTRRVVVTAAAIGLMTGVLAAQTSPRSTAAATSHAQTFSVSRTPWGDPDLQGIYTNKDESGIPFERPVDLAGKRVEEVTDQELAE